MTRLAVIGTGRIGAEIAYLATVLQRVDEIVLNDIAGSLLNAQVLDLRHTGTDIPISTDTAEIREADICVFAAGLPRNPEIRTRADLLMMNLPVATDCCRLLGGFGGVLITVTNPMDTNNYLIRELTGLPRERCIGFGGQVDSARFGLELAAGGIRAQAWVLGEHGDCQVPVFSTLPAAVAIPDREAILLRLRGASMEVIRGKGGTVFGPVLHIMRLMDQVIDDRREVIPCSCVLDGEYGASGCSLGVPARIGREGILGIEEWELDPWEQEKMAAAIAFERDLVGSVTI
jgi:malate dehydrogenase